VDHDGNPSLMQRFFEMFYHSISDDALSMHFADARAPDSQLCGQPRAPPAHLLQLAPLDPALVKGLPSLEPMPNSIPAVTPSRLLRRHELWLDIWFQSK